MDPKSSAPVTRELDDMSRGCGVFFPSIIAKIVTGFFLYAIGRIIDALKRERPGRWDGGSGTRPGPWPFVRKAKLE
jgi:hypothetical protein